MLERFHKLSEEQRRARLKKLQERMQVHWDDLELAEQNGVAGLKVSLDYLRERYAKLEAVERTLLKPGRMQVYDE